MGNYKEAFAVTAKNYTVANIGFYLCFRVIRVLILKRFRCFMYILYKQLVSFKDGKVYKGIV